MNQHKIINDAVLKYASNCVWRTDDPMVIHTWEGYRQSSSPLNVMFHRVMSIIKMGIRLPIGSRLDVTPEYEITPYSVDFAIEVVDSIASRSVVLCLVEIDGFNYHDRNRDQFNYERKRQNEITSECHRIFRYTYEDITERLLESCLEVSNFVESEIEKQESMK